MNARRVIKMILALPAAYAMTVAVALATAAVTAERKLKKRGL